jgi:hypothetical protein
LKIVSTFGLKIDGWRLTIEKAMMMKNFLLSALLLLAFSFELSASLCPAWAESEAPKLTPAVQKAVYTAQQAMEKKMAKYGQDLL